MSWPTGEELERRYPERKLRRRRMDLANRPRRSKPVDELERPVVTAGDGYPPAGEETQVIGPLWTILEEGWWHNRYMNRDLDVIEGGKP